MHRADCRGVHVGMEPRQPHDQRLDLDGQLVGVAVGSAERSVNPSRPQDSCVPAARAADARRGAVVAKCAQPRSRWRLPPAAIMVVEARATSWRSVARRLQASPDCLTCLAELRRPRAGFWPSRFPLRHEPLVGLLRLGRQHLTVTQRLDIERIGWATPAALLLRLSCLKLHRAGLDGGSGPGPLSLCSGGIC